MKNLLSGALSKKTLVYLRASNYAEIQMQRYLCFAYCHNNSVHIKETFCDIGEKQLTNRVGIQHAISFMSENKDINTLVLVSMPVLSDNWFERHLLIAAISALGYSTKSVIDTKKNTELEISSQIFLALRNTPIIFEEDHI